VTAPTPEEERRAEEIARKFKVIANEAEITLTGCIAQALADARAAERERLRFCSWCPYVVEAMDADCPRCKCPTFESLEDAIEDAVERARDRWLDSEQYSQW
jgi:hypothetical protein